MCYHLTTWHATTWQDPFCYAMTYPDLVSISYHDWLLVNITIVMLSLYTKHDTPVSYNYHDNGNVVPDYLL